MRIALQAYAARHPCLQGLALLLPILLLYLPSLSAPFIWDDNLTLTENPFVRNPDGLRFIWFTAQATDYYPLTWSSLWFEWRLWGLDPSGYHLTNILLHGASVILIWRILLRLQVPGAWIIALLFGIHPLAVDSVVWISQRKNTLSLFFASLALLSYLKYRALADRPALCFYLLSIIAFAAALLSKSSIIGLPLLLLILAWAQTGSLGRRDLLRVGPHLLLAAVATLLTFWFQGKAIGIGLAQSSRPADIILSELSATHGGILNLLERPLLAGQAFGFYFLKTILPVDLCMIYERWELAPQRIITWLPALLLLATATILYRLRDKIGRGPIAAFSAALILLLPVLGIFEMAFHKLAWVANHLAYLGIPCFLVLLGSLLSLGLAKGPPWCRSLATVLIGITILLFGSLTRHRIALHQSSEALWRDNIALAPRAFAAHNHLGVILCKSGRFEEGIRLFEESVRLAPALIDSRSNLALACLSTGRTQDAIRQFESLLQESSHNITLLSNLALAYQRNDQLEEAAGLQRRILQLRPGDPKAISNLSVLLGNLKQDAEAAELFPRALRITPDSATLHSGFAQVLYRQGSLDRALQHALRAIALEPASAEPLTAAALDVQDRARANGDPATVNRLETHLQQLR